MRLYAQEEWGVRAYKISKTGAGEAVHRVKVATAKPDDLNLTPRTHMAEEN